VRFLRERRCKLIVVACNTATAAAIGQLRAKHDLLFVGMEPALKPAAQATRSGVIGILATHGTFQGSHFHHTRAAHAQGVEVLIEEGQGLVELVERGETASPEAYHLLRRYLTPMVQAGADQIVLGCSHYPFLTQTMQDILGTRAQVVDPAPAVARQVARLLQQENLTCQETATASYHFYTTGTLNQLQRMVRDLVRPEIYDSCHFARVHLPMIDA
jgi:glutamate racemase